MRKERELKTQCLVQQGFLKSERIKAAMLKVRREELIPLLYRDYAYQEVLLPLPGEKSRSPAPTAIPSFMRYLVLMKATGPLGSDSAPDTARLWHAR